MSFIQEIKTGKRRINKKITNLFDDLFVLSVVAMMGLMVLKIIGIDLI